MSATDRLLEAARLTTGPVPAIAAYLAELSDDRWTDLDDLAGELLSRWSDVSADDLDRGISVSLAITQSRLAEVRSAGQTRVEHVRQTKGALKAAEMIASAWASHNTGMWRGA